MTGHHEMPKHHDRLLRNPFVDKEDLNLSFEARVVLSAIDFLVVDVGLPNLDRATTSGFYLEPVLMKLIHLRFDVNLQYSEYLEREIEELEKAGYLRLERDEEGIIEDVYPTYKLCKRYVENRFGIPKLTSIGHSMWTFAD